ncbi:MAG: hypothetical protein QOF57_860 [Frankiaceae bacterium]|jgi:uncharacterized protein (DUF58 family)|nr:hypothetical protein [Frankiaceae bacterium]MDQ1727508.1 hypothetical protein [Frankiaceae bacterium]
MALTSRAGLVVLLGAVLVLLLPLGGATVAIVAGAVIVCAVADLLLAAPVRVLGITRTGPPSTKLGEPIAMRLVVANPSQRALRALIRDAWQPSAGVRSDRHRVLIPAAESRALTTVLVPRRRGTRTADRVTVRSFGPLGIAARQRSRVVPGSVQVLPPFTSRRHLPERLARLKEIEGIVAARGRGQGTEFDTLRDYVPGDDVRTIDWRGTARRDTVVVRTWRPERDRRIVIVIDTGRTSAARVGDATRLDSAIDAALLLAALAGRAGDRVDFLAYDVTTRAAVDRANRDTSLGSLVRSMTDLQPALVETDLTGLAVEVLRRVRGRRSLVVLFTGLDTVSVESGLLPALGALGRRHTVLIAAVGDPVVAEMATGRGTAENVYAAAAAARVGAERRRSGELLRRRGAEVVDAAPERFAPAVADAYLSLKAAGRL